MYRIRDANAAGEPVELTLLRSIELHLPRQFDALAAGRDAAVQMIDTSVARVPQYGARTADNNHQNKPMKI